MVQEIRPRRGRLIGLALISLAFVALAAQYVLSTPYFEGTDEYHHFRFALRLLEEKSLPVIDERDVVFAGESHQPPLYYALSAAVASALLATSLPTRLGLSDMAALLYAGRWLSVLGGLLALWGTYALAGLLFPRRPWLPLGAAALVAFTPTFVGQSTILSNDSFTAAAGTGLLVLAAVVMGARPVRREHLLLLGVVAGLGALVKVSILYLAAPLLVALLLQAYRGRSWPALLADVAIVGLAALAVGGWWYGRNWLVYGDPLAWALNGRLNPGNVHPAPPALSSYLALLPMVWETLWFAFGSLGQLRAPTLAYDLFWLMLVVAGLGLGRAGWLAFAQSRAQWPPTLIRFTPFALAVAVGVLAIFRYHASYVGAGHGRYLYPALGALIVLLVRGLAEFRGPWHLTPVPFTVAGLLALAISTPAVFLAPSLARPTVVDPATLAALAQPLEVTFEQQIRLRGFQLATAAVQPGDNVQVTLFWQSLGSVRTNWTFYLHLLDSARVLRAQYDSTPMHGRYPALFWPPGQIWAERYTLPVPREEPPGLHLFEVGLYDLQTNRHAAAAAADGAPLRGGILFGQIKVKSSTETVVPQHVAQVAFAEGVRLYGWNWDGRRLVLFWQGAGRPQRSYTVFAHLRDAEGRVVAQHDGLPAAGTMPTDLWEDGDQIRDEHEIAAPAGQYELIVGLYDLATGGRLGVASGGSEVRLGTVASAAPH